MDQIKEKLQESTKILDPYATQIPPLRDGAASLKVNPGLLLGGILSVIFLIVMLVKGSLIVMTFITVLYPAMHSIRAIESPEEDDDKVWLTYWMIFGILNVAETFFGFIFWIIPYWGWLRLGLFVWLLLPNFRGSEVIYNSVVRPLMKKNEALIKEWIDKAKNAADKAAQEAKAQASDPNLMMKAANLANQAQ